MTTKTHEKPQGTMVTTEGDDAPLKALLSRDNIKKRFNEVLGPRRGAQFISSILTVWTASKSLQKCTAESILGAAAQAAALDLSIVPTIGHAAIVPYKDLAQFQIMTRGIIQLAHRSGKYKRMNLAEVYEGQLISHNEFSGTVKLDASKKKSDRIIGFYFVFELHNGFLQEAYWSTTRCIAHGLKYSKSFGYGSGLWADDPAIPRTKDNVDFKALRGILINGAAYVTYGSGTFSMCAKTVVKNTLTKWGPLSSDMMDAFTADQSAILSDGTRDYIDATDVPESAEQPPMPRRASEKKKEAEEVMAESTVTPKTWQAKGLLNRVASTELSGNPVDVLVLAVGGTDEKIYTSVREVAESARGFVGKNINVKADVVAGKLWLVEFSPA